MSWRRTSSSSRSRSVSADRSGVRWMVISPRPDTNVRISTLPYAYSYPSPNVVTRDRWPDSAHASAAAAAPPPPPRPRETDTRRETGGGWERPAAGGGGGARRGGGGAGRGGGGGGG